MANATEGDLPQFHDQKNGGKPRQRPEQGPTRSRPSRGRSHQLRDQRAQKNSQRRPAQGDFIRNNEMLEVDESRRQQKRGEGEIGHSQGKTEFQPQSQKDASSQKLDQWVSEGNRRAASRAFAAKKNPAHHREVFIPRDGFFAGGAERSFRIQQAHPTRHPMDAGIQKRSRHRAQHGGENREKNGHAFSRPGSTSSQIAWRRNL